MFQSQKSAPDDKYFKKGLEFFKKRKAAKAIEMFHKSLEKNPGYIDTYAYIAMTYAAIQDFHNSYKWFSDGLKIDPENPDLWFNQGMVLKKMRQYEESIKSLDECLKRNPQYSDALIVKGNCCWELKEYDTAIKYFDESIKIDPNNGLAWKNKFELLQEIGREDEARAMLDQINETLKEDPTLVGIKPVKIPKWENKGLEFVTLGEVSSLKFGEVTDKIQHLLDMYKVEPEGINMFPVNNQLIASIEQYPGAFKAFQQETGIKPIEVRTKESVNVQKPNQTSSSQSSEQTIICPKCYVANNSNNKFCVACGKKIAK